MSVKRFPLLFLAFFGVVCAIPEVLAYSNNLVKYNKSSSITNPQYHKPTYSPILNPTKASVSLDLKGYVNPEVNIERIDRGTTLDIFKNDEARFRVTCNNDKTVVVTFNTVNDWKLLSKDGNSISYEGSFKGKDNRTEVINEEKNTVSINNSELTDSKYEFGVKFKPIEENLKAGEYSDRITISVTTEQ